LLTDSVSARRFSAVLIGIFAALALLLAAVGTYGVMNTSVRHRTNEIAIRLALGAQPATVLRAIVGQGARLALAGVAAGCAGALAIAPLISALLFGVASRDPATFCGAAALLVAVALVACYLPARRAMRVDPTAALRHE
jgi:putative ABC transport system permease protein